MKIVSRQWSVVSLTLSAMLFALCVSARAQQAGKIHRVGFLSGSFPHGRGPARSGEIGGISGLQRELRALGYIEGKNIAFEYRYAEDKLDRTSALADELVGLKVDVIVAAGATDVLAAKSATSTIPVVFLESGFDPVAQGLVASLGRPGGNITGFTTIAWVLAGKRLELLKETIPKLSRVAVLWDPKAPASVPQWKESQQVAQQLGLQVHSMEVSSAGRYESAFKDATKGRSDALAVTRHRLANAYQKRIIELAVKNRLPAIYYREDFVNNGGLMSYGPDEVEPLRRAAAMVDKILKGTKPADIPVEQPTKFELVINLKTAKQIGLTIPPNVLARADRVIR
jgi:putative ABC transport system substrate-binding protein